MTNYEWLHSLSVKELAGTMFDICLCCNYHDAVGCKGGNRICKDGILEWLNKKYREPMPETKAGDVFLYAEKTITYFGVFVYGNFIYLPDKGRCCYFDGEIKEKVFSIRRYNIETGKMEDIWRAE